MGLCDATGSEEYPPKAPDFLTHVNFAATTKVATACVHATGIKGFMLCVASD